MEKGAVLGVTVRPLLLSTRAPAKEFEFFAASLGTTGDEGGRGGTRGTTGRTGTTAMKEVCWVEVGCV